MSADEGREPGASTLRAAHQQGPAAAKPPIGIQDTDGAEAPEPGRADVSPLHVSAAFGFTATLVVVRTASDRTYRRLFLGRAAAISFAKKVRAEGDQAAVLGAYVTPLLNRGPVG